MEIFSPDFENNGSLPVEFTCSGDDISPEINWSGAPAGTKSFALIMEDPDAPRGSFTHWIVYGMHENTSRLPKDMSKAGSLPDGTKQGINGFGNTGYGGPCPPAGKAHHYVFSIYALDDMLDLEPAISMDRLMRAIQPHILETRSITVLFERSTQ